MRTKTIWVWTSIISAVALLISTAATVVSFSEAKRTPPPSFAIIDSDVPNEGILVWARDRDLTVSTARAAPEWKGRAEVVGWMEGDVVEWQVPIEQAGRYELTVGYYPLEGNGQDIAFQLLVDGQPMSDHNEPFSLNRLWRDESGLVKQNRGNDLRPKQVEERVWTAAKLTIPGSQQGGGLVLDLEQGYHRIRMENIRESAMLHYIQLTKESETQSYADYMKKHSNRGMGGVPNGFRNVVQAEYAYLKSSSGLFPTMDRTSPLTFPYHPVKMRINTIGGSNWDTPGQWISWQVEVPEDGWYKLGLRYHQTKVRGSFVTRRVYIDGTVPFREMEHVRFPYHLDWKVQELGQDRGEPYLFYLTKGNHEIKLEVTLGELTAPIHQINEIVTELQGVYREIVMITGVRPDPYRDYEINKSIPGLLERFEALQARMEQESARLAGLTGSNNPGTRSLKLLVNQLGSFIDRPDTIPKRLESYKKNITGLADWILTVSSQPLEVDYLYAAAPEDKVPREEASFWQKGIHELRAFIGSFLENYDSISDYTNSARSIEVWTGLGRDQAYVVKRLIEDTFTPETGIDVKFNLVENSLVVAVMAGEGPDVNLLTSRGDTMNLAIRGALQPLDQLEGFRELPDQYMPTAFVPYEYQGYTYAIPEEQEYFMMFFRHDILKQLELTPPETWEELMKLAPELQNHNMQIGLPYENLDAFQLLTRGMGTLNLFPTLLMQNGSGVYNEKLSGTRFEEPNAYQAFKKWTDFYTLFDYPIYKDDFNRFRTGEMPIVITSYKLYNRLVKAAPEIAGTWSFKPIPGIRGSDGTIDRSTGATGTASIILKNSSNIADAWTFLKWWNRPDTQSRFVKELENELGVLGRRTPANLRSFDSTNWSRSEQALLLEQWSQVEEIPELPGGYYTSRNIDNAFRNVVFQMNNSRESLFFWNKQINEEIKRKRYEFGVSE